MLVEVVSFLILVMFVLVVSMFVGMVVNVLVVVGFDCVVVWYFNFFSVYFVVYYLCIFKRLLF